MSDSGLNESMNDAGMAEIRLGNYKVTLKKCGIGDVCDRKNE